MTHCLQQTHLHIKGFALSLLNYNANSTLAAPNQFRGSALISRYKFSLKLILWLNKQRQYLTIIQRGIN
jgi:hypothetical protein